MSSSIKLKVRGSFDNVEKFFKRMISGEQYRSIDAIAQRGVAQLSAVTPRDTGATAESWTYEIKIHNGAVDISFLNYNKTKGIPIVVLLRYGHGTRNGGYVKGRDFITPVTQPIFDEIANQVWEEVTK